jgi:membrane protease YdiL (CAAX protease family)
VVHVRKAGEELARACEPGDLAAEGGSVTIQAETLVSRAAEGPFAPAAVALERDPALRDAFARALRVPSMAAWDRARFVVLGLTALPLVMLVELDRELVGKGLLGSGRLAVDGLIAGYVVFELTRRTPRLPAVAAAAMLAVAMRWGLVVARLCGQHVHVMVWAATALAVVAAGALLVRAPSRERVAKELLGKLGISRSDVLAAKRASAPPGALVAAAALAAAALPALLWALRRAGVGLWPQAFAFVAYALMVPELARRGLAREPSADAVANERAGKESAVKEGAAAGVASTPKPVLAILFAIAAGLTLTAALLHGPHQFFDAGAELARCTGRLDDATRRLLAAEAAELSQRVASVRASTALVVMTTLVMPLAEERVYRGLLMNVLVRRYGMTYGLFASAAAFGLAHVGVYELALYQTVLLGIGFGLAYAEGGLLAAFVVHAAWNLLNVAR